MQNRWAIVYGQNDSDYANGLLSGFRSQAGAIGIVVQEPQWVEVPSGRPGFDDFKQVIMSDINPAECAIIIIVAFGGSNYKAKLK